MKRQDAFAPVALTSPENYAKLFDTDHGRQMAQYITVEGMEFYRTMASPSSPTRISDRLEILRLDALNAIRVWIDRASARQGFEGRDFLELSEDFTEYVSSSHRLPALPCLTIQKIHYDGVTVQDYKNTQGPVFLMFTELDEHELFRIVTWLEGNAHKLLCLDRWEDEDK